MTEGTIFTTKKYSNEVKSFGILLIKSTKKYQTENITKGISKIL